MTKQSGVVETCLKNTLDPFSLVVLAAYRAQELESGIASVVSAQGHKNTIVALQEIAAHRINTQDIMDRMVKGFQRYAFLEESEKDRQSGPYSYQTKEGGRPVRSDWQEHWTPPSQTASESLFETIEWNTPQATVSDDEEPAEEEGEEDTEEEEEPMD